MTLFTGPALFVFAGSLVPRLGEMLIAAPAVSAMRHQHALPGRGQIGDGLSGNSIENHRAEGHQQNHVVARMPGAIRAFAVTPAVGLEFAIVTVAQQSIVVDVGFQENASAVPAVASGRTAARNEFLAPERHASVAAMASLHEYFGFIGKHE